MPQNFPEVWLGRVVQNLNNADNAEFLNGIEEIPVDVTQINQGTVTEKNKIYVPTTDFEVDVLVNNTSYPIALQEYDDDTIEINLDKYQTKVVTLPDDDVLGASYDKIDQSTRAATRSILVNKYKRAIHALAPEANDDKTPVLTTSGEDDGSGRKMLTYDDLVKFKRACDKAGFNQGERRLILCDDHWNDLLMDRKRFGNLLVNYSQGSPAPIIAGFNIYRYDNMPVYDTSALTKEAVGATDGDGKYAASVAFVKEGVAKKTGLTKQYYVPASSNTTGQANELAYRHYFIAVPYKKERIGAIVSQAV